MTDLATAPRPLATPAPRPADNGLLSHLLTWLLQADRRYREARRLREIPDHLLADVGIKRSDLDRALDHPLHH